MKRLNIQEPWLTYISTGVKRFEGRLAGGSWSKLPLGETVIAYSPEQEVTLRIVGHHYFSGFGEAWSALGTALIPEEFGVVSRQDADRIYSQFWTPDEIRQKGVDAVEIETIA